MRKVVYHQHNCYMKSHACDAIIEPRYFVKRENSRGPSTEPCGTPVRRDEEQRQTPSRQPGRIRLLDRMQTKKG